MSELSMTIGEFCAAERISKFFYHKLKRAGLAPREMRLGAAVRISPEARADWHRARENPKGDEAKAVQVARDGLLRRSRAAAQRAVASSKHVSAKRGRRA